MNNESKHVLGNIDTCLDVSMIGMLRNVSEILNKEEKKNLILDTTRT